MSQVVERPDGRPFKTFLRWLNLVERATLIGLLAGLVAIVFLQVVARFLSISLGWSEEVSRFLFIWFCWIGSSYAVHDYLHIRITAQFLILPHALNGVIVRLGDLVWIGFNICVIYASWMFLESITQFPYVAMITGVSMFWIFLPVLVSFSVFTLRLIINLFDPDHVERSIRGQIEGEINQDFEIEELSSKDGDA